MKKINLFALIVLGLSIVSCSSDDSSSANNDQAINMQEDQNLSAETVSSNLTIANATKNTGNPPSPTGTLPFTVDETTVSAFQNSGFNITIPNSAAGAYLQVQQSDGTLASEYYDIVNGTTSNTNKHSLTRKASNVALKDSDSREVEIDFGAAIEPGKFCYIICIYDNEGNISQPQEVCVEVEAWGGNSALVGTWNLVRSEFTYTGQDEVEIDIVGVEYCSGTSLFCEDQTEIEIEKAFCDTTKFLKLVLNADGTYRYDTEYTDIDIDFDVTRQNCEAAFQEKNNIEYSIGNWAYDEEENKFTLVEFQFFNSLENDNVQIEEDGYLLFDGVLTLDGSSFSLFEEETFGDRTETDRIEFEK